MPRNIEIHATDGYTLRGTAYEGGERAIVVAAAMGVKRRFYDAFAQYAAERGFSVLTFDYRGIGESRPPSLRGFPATMADWGRLDLPAAISFALDELRPKSLSLVGHSCGGQIAALAPNVGRVGRLAFAACQSGWWRHWPRPRGYGLAALWYTMPSIARLFGYFPSRRVGLGSEDLPAGVASQWATSGRHPEYVFRFMTGEERARYAALARPLLSWSFADDAYAPKRAVDWLAGKYASADVTRRHIEGRKIGHFGFFRKDAEDLWEETLEFLR